MHSLAKGSSLTFTSLFTSNFCHNCALTVGIKKGCLIAKDRPVYIWPNVVELHRELCDVPARHTNIMVWDSASCDGCLPWEANSNPVATGGQIPSRICALDSKCWLFLLRRGSRRTIKMLSSSTKTSSQSSNCISPCKDGILNFNYKQRPARVPRCDGRVHISELRRLQLETVETIQKTLKSR